MADRTLIADIGGTNTRVGLAENGMLLADTLTKYRNANFGGIEELLRTFQAETGALALRAAALAMAGPVRDGRGTLTNLDWTLDEDSLAGSLNAENVTVLNDLQAQGYALGHLPDHAYESIRPGAVPNGKATKLVVGIGTGFNAAPVFEAPFGRLVPPSEAGHPGLSVKTARDLDLAEFLAETHGFASVEDALSGRGLEAIYAWHRSKRADAPPRDAAQIMEARDETSLDAIKTMAEVMGRTISDLALSFLPFGGIFLIGGVARAMAQHCKSDLFESAYLEKGRFSDFVGEFGIDVIVDDDAALIGTAQVTAR